MTTRRQLLKSTSAVALLAALPGCASLRESRPPRERVTFAAIPRSEYGFSTTAEEVVAGLDLNGLTALITGCNSGLGYESLRVLAGAGVHVLGAARTRAKAEEACASVGGATTPLVLELSDMNSVVACARAAGEWLDANNKPLDILMCNAGIMAVPELEQIEVNGELLERQFVVNHLGHYLLTRRLLPWVTAAPQGRIVMVSSGGYRLAPDGGILFDDLGYNSDYKPFKAYGQSKLANVLMAKELSEQYFDAGITANAIAPGVVATNLGRYITGEMRDPDEPLGKGQKWPDAGAATQVYVATDPRLANTSGYYFEDCNPVELRGDYANDPALATQLWQVSEQLVQPYLG